MAIDYADEHRTATGRASSRADAGYHQSPFSIPIHSAAAAAAAVTVTGEAGVLRGSDGGGERLVFPSMQMVITPCNLWPSGGGHAARPPT